MLMGYRQLLGQQREDLAKHLDISATTLGRYEIGDRQMPEELFNRAVSYLKPKCGECFDEQEFRTRFNATENIKTLDDDNNLRGKYCAS